MQRYNNGPLCFWAWNGDMEDNEITAQLKDLADSGMKGVFVHSRAGLKLPYLGKEWFEKYKLTVAECEKLGLEVWIYDEDGWPSGFGGGQVYKKSDEFKQRYITAKTVTLPCEEIRKSGILAVYKINDDGFVKTDDDLDNKTGDYLILYIECNPVYIDILNKDAVQYFIETTHEKYKKELGQYFGGVIKGIFTDEPHISPRGLPWGKYYQSFFKEKRGYGIFEALPYLFIKKEGYRKYRYDYWKTISEMTQEYYAKPYYKWCEENNLIFTGHYACEEGQLDQVATNGGVMPLYEFQHIPGVDALGNRLVPATVFKQAEAVSCQLGNKLVMCETYACSGYDATFSDIMWIWGYQAALGVNVPCLSISMYSLEGTRKRDYPTFFSYQMPWWEKFPLLAKSFDLINGKMIEGSRKQEILLINPVTGIWCEKGKDNEIEEKQISAQFRMLTESLLDLQREFDYGDEQIIKKHARISGGKFYVGKCGYDTVMVPNTCNLESSTLLLLKQFSQTGGNVVFVGGLPGCIDGKTADKNDFGFEKVVIQSRTDLLRKYFVCNGQKKDIQLIDRYTRRTAAGFVTSLRCYDDYKALFAVNTSREDYKRVRLCAKGSTGLKKICLDGRQYSLCAKYDSFNDVSVADVEIEPQEACFFVTTKESIVEQKPVSVRYLSGFNADISENVLVIDKVRIKADESQLGEDYTVFATEKLYKHIDGLGKDILLTMSYDFYINSDLDCPIDIACEDDGAEVYINGNKLTKKGWFTDRHFGRYDISKHYKKGKNTVEMKRKISAYKSRYNLDEVFQSVTNVFSYEYYIENIYIIGKFDIAPYEDIEYGENCYRISEKGLYIDRYTPKCDIGELTKQGLYNFSGKVTANKAIDVKDLKGYKYALAFDKPTAAAIDVYLNGVFVATCGIAPYNTDITEYLKEGQNDLRIVLYSSARNLFGPFHHIKGKHNYVGHTVFKGYVEFEDPVVFPELAGKSTWTNSYAFVYFGAENMRVEKYKI